MQLTLNVEDVDATADRLRSLGIELLNGPMDRPWGPRTASVQDPDGYKLEFESFTDVPEETVFSEPEDGRSG